MSGPSFDQLDNVILDAFMQDPDLQQFLYGTVDRAELSEALDSQLIMQSTQEPASSQVAKGHQPPHGPVILTVSPNRMTAWVELPPSLKSMGQDALHVLLNNTLSEEGIVYGVQERQLERLAQNPIFGAPLVAARGTPPKASAASAARFSFHPSPSLKPLAPNQYGVVVKRPDFVTLVRPGDLLCTRPHVPAQHMGRTVYGDKVTGPHENITLVEAGANVQLSEDGRSMFATVAGEAVFREGVLSVLPIRRLASVDTHTGDIKYDGSVYVEGSVEFGLTVEATGNVIVGEHIGGSQIIAGGHVAAGKGIKGGTGSVLQVGGSLRTPYLENVQADIGGDLYADVLYSSDITCAGGIYVLGRRGRLVGGRCAARQIEAVDLGNDAGAPTRLELLGDETLRRRLAGIATEEVSWEERRLHLEVLVRTAANAERAESLGRLLKQVEQKCARLVANIDFLEQLLYRTESVYPPRISAYNTLYPGVSCDLLGASWSDMSQHSHCTLTAGASGVELHSLRKN